MSFGSRRRREVNYVTGDTPSLGHWSFDHVTSSTFSHLLKLAARNRAESIFAPEITVAAAALSRILIGSNTRANMDASHLVTQTSFYLSWYSISNKDRTILDLCQMKSNLWSALCLIMEIDNSRQSFDCSDHPWPAFDFSMVSWWSLMIDAINNF